MIQLPIEPNLRALQEIFIFDFSKYQKVDINDFEIKLLNTDFLPLHEVNHIFEVSDSLKFYARNYGTKKEPKYSRYIFYKTQDNFYFVARLNDVDTIYNFIGVNNNYLSLFPKSNFETRIYKVWKKPLKKFATKRAKKFESNTIKLM